MQMLLKLKRMYLITLLSCHGALQQDRGSEALHGPKFTGSLMFNFLKLEFFNDNFYVTVTEKVQLIF
ncbi:hypothetical protein HK096_008319 [Nowakowskiella sp. JEL0078]|nr:hypothetical protein HK096_008319 [Nowakowskiella sp. JEL0078]